MKLTAKLQKNWNLDDKKSLHSVKKTEKFKFKWQKNFKKRKKDTD